MRTHSITRFATIVLALAASIISACTHRNLTADTRHECEFGSGVDRVTRQAFDPETATRPSPAPIVKVVEFTDNGEIADRCQWSDALYEVRGNRSIDGKFDRAKLLVVYVHGWKHDGSRGDTDLGHFTNLVTTLGASQQAGNRDVVGIYAAWPGLETSVPVIENLTFWGRKGAADRVSAAANFSKFLSAISSIRVQRDNPNDFIVGIGHSFGARILFSVASPLLLHQVQQSHPGKRLAPYKRIDGFIDLTVLLNPAFEATRYTAFDTVRRWQETFDDNQGPLILTVATDNDYATKFAYPTGQVVGTRWDERERTTMGNYSEFFTHTISRTPSSAVAGPSTAWYDNFCKDELCLVRRAGDRQPRNPFLVATTDRSVLDGHNGIWSEAFQRWLTLFIVEAESQARSRRPGSATAK